MKPLKELSYNLRKKLVNSQPLTNDEIKQVVSHKLYLLGSVRGFNIIDRVSVQFHIDRIKWFYDADQPNHEAIKKQSDAHRLSLKYNPTRSFKQLTQDALFDITETEQHLLFEDYIKAYPDNAKLQVGSLRDNLHILKILKNEK
jgi:hypothetical protein